MGMLDAVAQRVADGATVAFRPSGSSMVPPIRSRQQVVVAPADSARLAVGDIVLARVAGTVHLHLVSAVDPARRRDQVQISNNRGRVNGWTGYDRVFGICLSVDGTPRAGALCRTAMFHPPVRLQTTPLGDVAPPWWARRHRRRSTQRPDPGSSLSSALARLTFKPSISPSRPSRSASAILSARLLLSARRVRCAGSGYSIR